VTTRWVVSTPDRAARAILDAGIGRRAERYVPRAYGVAAALRTLAPGLVRHVLAGSGAAVLTTRTGAEQPQDEEPH
jgi:uncharacterized protein